MFITVLQCVALPHPASLCVLLVCQGEIVKSVNKLSDDWLEVQQADGTMGIAPVNHLQELDPTLEYILACTRVCGGNGARMLPVRVGEEVPTH